MYDIVNIDSNKKNKEKQKKMLILRFVYNQQFEFGRM